MTAGGGGPEVQAGPGNGERDKEATRGRADRDEKPRFGTTLTRVLLVQVVTLILLWLLQSAYHG